MNCYRGSLFLRLFATLAIAFLAAAIYPEDHWSFSSKLTVANFDETVKTQVDSGKTLFVRWIASSG